MRLNKKSAPAKKSFIPAQVLIDPKKTCIRIWTDGSCLVNPGGAGSYSFVITEDDKAIHEYGEHYVSTTNNRMEIMAALSAIEYIAGVKEVEQVVLYTDSTYVYNGITKKAGKQANKNGDLWEKIQKVVAANPHIQYMWTKGHVGQKWNEHADELCREMYKKVAIPDKGFVYANTTKTYSNVVEAKQFLLDRLWPKVSEAYRLAYWESNISNVQDIVHIMEEYKNQ